MPARFLKEGGELGALIAAFDWSKTPLGPLAGWSQPLKTATALLLRSSVPIVMLWAPSGVMIYNDAYSVFAGERHPQLLGSNVREGWPEVADFNDNVMKVGLAGGTLAYRDRILELNRTGTLEKVWLDLDYSPVLDETGEPAGVIAIVIETTQRVLADRRIASALERQRRLFSQMPGFVGVVTGPDHVYEYVNAAYVAVAGDRNFIGRSVRDVFPDLNGQGFFELLDEVYSSGRRYVAEGMPVKLEGERGQRFVDLLYEPIRDAAGAVTGIFVGGYDVTEAHRVAGALRASEARLRAINADLEREVVERARERAQTWQVTPDLLSVLDPSGAIEATNPAWQATLGWSDPELRGPLVDLVHPEDRADVVAALGRAQDEPVLRFAARVRARDGGYRWLAWVAVPQGGRIYGSARDITDEKAAENELARAQDALRQAQKMEAIGQLTGGIAHDFNNLLAGIMGSLELLERRLGRGQIDDTARYIAAAQESANRAAALTQRLLAFSRRQTLDPKPTDVHRLIAGMEELIRRSIGPGITLTVTAADGLWLCRIDPSQLENAVLNLSINARDAMPDGGRIAISATNEMLDRTRARQLGLPAGDYVALRVSDTGTGMTPAVMAQAFDPFFTTKPIGQGTGLGLSMIHGFVRQSGGEVRIASALGEGTTISLYLPRFSGVPADPETATSAVPDGRGRGETILVIDDEPTVRMLMSEVLGEAGYHVIDGGDAQAGLTVLRSPARIDLLVTDVGLPNGMNGRQLADAARQLRPELRVLFVTGYAETAVLGNGLLGDGMKVIVKPFAMADFAGKVRDIVGR